MFIWFVELKHVIGSLLTRCILPGTPQGRNAFLYGEVQAIPLLDCEEFFVHWFRNHRVVGMLYAGRRVLRLNYRHLWYHLQVCKVNSVEMGTNIEINLE